MQIHVNGLEWNFYTGKGWELAGFIPSFLYLGDPRPAAEQFNERYAHGGGWFPFGKDDWALIQPNSVLNRYTLKYQGEEKYAALAFTQLRDETIVVFEYAWVAIVQPDGTFEVARMD